jgi:RNA polymerase sigma factor (sigma-70 family)
MWIKHKDIEVSKSKSYLITTAYNTAINQINKDKIKEDYKNANNEIIFHYEQYSDLKEILDKAMNLLPKPQKDVILLIDYAGYSYKEIGEITGLSESQVCVYIFRARNFLRQYLGKIEEII